MSDHTVGITVPSFLLHT